MRFTHARSTRQKRGPDENGGKRREEIFDSYLSLALRSLAFQVGIVLGLAAAFFALYGIYHWLRR